MGSTRFRVDGQDLPIASASFDQPRPGAREGDEPPPSLEIWRPVDRTSPTLTPGRQLKSAELVVQDADGKCRARIELEDAYIAGTSYRGEGPDGPMQTVSIQARRVRTTACAPEPPAPGGGVQTRRR